MKKYIVYLLILLSVLFGFDSSFAVDMFQNPKFQAFDTSGVPLSGGKLYTYIAGTTTEKATYSNYALSSANTNPIILDSYGQATIYGTGLYKFVLKTSADVTIWTLDNVRGSGKVGSSYYSSDYGADPTGATDSTTALQSTLTAATGATAVLEEGTYIISAALNYFSNTRIIAQGDVTIKMDATLGAPTIMLQPNAAAIENVLIEGIIFDQRSDVYGPQSSYPVVSINKTKDVTIRNNRFKNVTTMAVWCDGDDTNSTYRFKILNNEIVNSESSGFSFFGTIYDSIVQGNTIHSVKDDAIAFQEGTTASTYARGVSILGNVIREADVRNTDSSVPNGILIFGAYDVDIVGNVVDKTVSNGIRVSESTNLGFARINIVGNTIYRAGVTDSTTTGINRSGIYLYCSSQTCSEVNISGNKINGSKNDGISVAKVNKFSVTGNNVVLNEYAGIDIDSCTDFVVSGNTVLDNGTASTPYGILINNSVSASDRMSITGNRSGDTRSGGSRTQTHGVYYAATTTSSLCVANDLQNNSTAAIGGTIPTTFVAHNNLGYTTNYLNGDLYPIANDTYYLGKNDDDDPLAWKGVIFKDTTDGKYYRLQITSGATEVIDLSD